MAPLLKKRKKKQKPTKSSDLRNEENNDPSFHNLNDIEVVNIETEGDGKIVDYVLNTR